MNPVIRGRAMYYRCVSFSETFGTLDWILRGMLWILG
ncbi:MAG: hypothetical protein NTV68_11905 [Methanomicrobiales archaeon]|nr:hypothetical protein [Methanomicrobiales archaeon]